MKVKTAELTGLALRYAVGLTQGGGDLRHDTVATWWMTLNGKEVALQPGWAASMTFCPDIDFATGGPLIHRERIGTRPTGPKDSNWWLASPSGSPFLEDISEGSTLLIAGLRAIVRKHLGTEVEVPDELLKDAS